MCLILWVQFNHADLVLVFEGVNENLEFFAKVNFLTHLAVAWVPSADILLSWCFVKAHTIKLHSPPPIILKLDQEFFSNFK